MTLLSQVLDIPRRSLYTIPSQKILQKDQLIHEQILAVLEQNPGYMVVPKVKTIEDQI